MCMPISAGKDIQDVTYTDEIARVSKVFDYGNDRFFRTQSLDHCLDHLSRISVEVGSSHITNAVMQQKPSLGTKDRLLYAFIATGTVASMSWERTGELVLSKMRRAQYPMLWSYLCDVRMPVEFSDIKNDFRKHARFIRFTDAWLAAYASSETNLFKLNREQQLEKVISVVVQEEENAEAGRRAHERKHERKSRKPPKGPYGPGTQMSCSGWGSFYRPPRKKAKGDAILVPQSAADCK